MTSTGIAVGPADRLRAVALALRPRQWIKNLLVVAVPLAAGELAHRDVVIDTTLAFVAFCAAASATYLMNDSVDAQADRTHPTKRHRPIAAGLLPVPVALALAAGLALTAMAVGFLTAKDLGLVVVAYLVSTSLYSLWLKHEPVLEMALLSLGFLLRALAGGAATGTPVSSWFLIVAGFGSLFMAAGKRYSELVADRDPTDGPASGRTR